MCELDDSAICGVLGWREIEALRPLVFEWRIPDATNSLVVLLLKDCDDDSHSF